MSEVVNDRPDVAPATRERVRRLLEQHNYSRPGRRHPRGPAPNWTSWLARWAAPPLTTVRQPLAEMGRVAAQLLEALIAGRDPDAYHVELVTALVVRASTTPPRARR